MRTRALAQYAKGGGASPSLFLPQSYNGRAVAPPLSRGRMQPSSQRINAIPEKEGAGYKARRIAYSNKAIEWIYTEHKPIVATLRPNSFVPAKASRPLQVEARTIAPLPEDLRARPVKVEKVATDRVPLTEAEIVVSGGRGLQRPRKLGHNRGPRQSPWRRHRLL